jgi:hypothetical protein
MEAKQESSSWREFLGELIKNPQEKKRLALEANIRLITLKRWVEGKSRPREENLLGVAHALSPHLSATFLRLAEAEFPSLAQVNVEQNRIVPEIRSEIYAQVLQLYALTPASLARQTLEKLILEHAIKNLDPTRVGMAVTLLCCVPPRAGQKIRALCQIGGIGTPPWERDQERKVLFVGAESVAGTVVTGYRTLSIESREEISFSPVNWEKLEQSTVAAPILRHARIAGALVASSARPYFFTPAHIRLLELYAHLIVLIFSPIEFYDPGDIQLGIMPKIASQDSYLTDFDQRVKRKLQEFQAGKGGMTSQLAHQYVWQDIADELLSLPPEE